MTTALDITGPDSVAAATAATGHVTLLVNDAGCPPGPDLLDGGLAGVELETATPRFGTLSVVRTLRRR